MIGQHLILRCIKGSYDFSSSPGYKVAAVSDSVRALPSAQQSDINKIILTNSQIPDAVKRPASGENRGVLRLFQSRGMLFAMRSRRVYDLCDTHGNVSYVHSYIATDNERNTLLMNPFGLANENSFDRYETVNERAGGLTSGNEIKVNDGLIPNITVSESFSEDILVECGFDEGSFSKFIAAVCQHISCDGWIAVMLKGVDEELWNTSGGSEKGEFFLLKLLSLLPNCIARFFSGVSYWNESFASDSVKNFKVRILSGKYTDGLDNSAISLYDFHNGVIRSEVEAGSFGRMLWNCRNDEEELSKFHSFVERAFGKNVDRVLKLPELMDTITDYYSFELYSQSGNHEKLEQLSLQNSVASLLKLLGPTLSLFPKLLELTITILNFLCETVKHGYAFSEKLEQIALSFKKGDMVKALGSSLDDQLSFILIYNIANNKADAATASFVSDKIAVNQDTYLSKYFMSLIKDFLNENYRTVEECNNQIISLFCDIYRKTEYDQYHNELWNVLIKLYELNIAVQNYYNCVELCITLFSNLRTEAELLDVCSKLKFFISAEGAYGSRDIIIKALNDQFNKYDNKPKTVINIGKSIFGTEVPSTVSADKEFFPLFARLFPKIIACSDKEYTKIWHSQYNYILDNYVKDNFYLYPEVYFNDVHGEVKANSLYYIEIIRLRNNNINHIETGLNTVREIAAEGGSQGYKEIAKLLSENSDDGVKKILNYCETTDMIYRLFIHSFIEYRKLADQQSTSPYRERFYYNTRKMLARLTPRREVFQNIEKYLKEEKYYDKYYADIYFLIWDNKYSALPNNALCEKILETERSLADNPKQKEIMFGFADYLQDFFAFESIPDNDESIMNLLYKGIKEYNWSKRITINASQCMVVEMCHFIDDLTDDHISYFIDRLDSAYSNNDFTNLRLCSRRLKGKVRDIQKRFGDQQYFTKITLLAITYTCSTKSNCGTYLQVIRDNKQWNDSHFVLYGLRYLFMLKKSGTNIVQSHVESFVDKFRDLIASGDAEQRGNITKESYRTIYANEIQPYLEPQLQQRLYDAAKKTGSTEMKEMFKVKYEKSGQSGLQFTVKWYISLIICVVLIAVVYLLHSFVTPIAALSVAGAAFICATTCLVFCIALRKKGE